MLFTVLCTKSYSIPYRHFTWPKTFRVGLLLVVPCAHFRANHATNWIIFVLLLDYFIYLGTLVTVLVLDQFHLVHYRIQNQRGVIILCCKYWQKIISDFVFQWQIWALAWRRPVPGADRALQHLWKWPSHTFSRLCCEDSGVLGIHLMCRVQLPIVTVAYIHDLHTFTFLVLFIIIDSLVIDDVEDEWLRRLGPSWIAMSQFI